MYLRQGARRIGRAVLRFARIASGSPGILIPAVRASSSATGFAAARMKGSEHNDCFVNGEGKTATNGAGGINGGISNGNPVVFRIAVKPTSSIAKKQYSSILRRDGWKSSSSKGGTTPASPCAVRSCGGDRCDRAGQPTDRFLPKINARFLVSLIFAALNIIRIIIFVPQRFRCSIRC